MTDVNWVIIHGDTELTFQFFAGQQGVPRFFLSAIARRFANKAFCEACERPMTNFVACQCGNCLWKMPTDEGEKAFRALEWGRRAFYRQEALAAAGGSHSPAEINAILEAQNRRCLYCNRRFTGTVKATRDHLLPVTRGGGDWALNIVLACARCNSRRQTMAFRTYCRFLSPLQNQRILRVLVDRIASLLKEQPSGDALTCFDLALKLHDRGLMQIMQQMHWKGTKYVAVNRMLPDNAAGLIAAFHKMIRKEKTHKSKTVLARDTIRRIREAVKDGRLDAVFSPAAVNRQLGIDFAGVFLHKHREGNPGGNTEFFTRTDRGVYRLK